MVDGLLKLGSSKLSVSTNNQADIGFFQFVTKLTFLSPKLAGLHPIPANLHTEPLPGNTLFKFTCGGLPTDACTARASAPLRGVEGRGELSEPVRLVGSDTARRVGEVSPRKILEFKFIDSERPRSNWDTLVVNSAVKVQTEVRSAERLSAEVGKPNNTTRELIESLNLAGEYPCGQHKTFRLGVVHHIAQIFQGANRNDTDKGVAANGRGEDLIAQSRLRKVTATGVDWY